jgi:hypothetical protein
MMQNVVPPPLWLRNRRESLAELAQIHHCKEDLEQTYYTQRRPDRGNNLLHESEVVLALSTIEAAHQALVKFC